MHTNRLGATATLLPNDEVLVAGGDAGNATYDALSSAELYNPAAGQWSPACPPGVAVSIFPEGTITEILALTARRQRPSQRRSCRPLRLPWTGQPGCCLPPRPR